MSEMIVGTCAGITEKPEAVVLQTYTLQLIGPIPPKAFQLLNLQHWAFPSMMRETEENLSDLLPEGYSVTIRRWDQ